jgi:hypothetical protein
MPIYLGSDDPPPPDPQQEPERIARIVWAALKELP